MPPIYRIHPGIGVARLGNSPDEFCIAPENPAGLPIACDADGQPLPEGAGTTGVSTSTFKDGEGRIKRQAARFQVWVYDEQSPEGRPLKLNDPVEGGGNAGTLVDVQWRVYLANKKASWYEFEQLDGEAGYSSTHVRRNAAVTGDGARQRLMIDPGPRSVDMQNRRARFDRDGGGDYATIFPPPLQPHDIDTLGEILTDDAGRLLVLGGHGHSGSHLFNHFGQPRIDDYANNDGWFDDTSDGPVMARLVMFSPLVKSNRFIDVEYPAWVLAAYPEYVPEIVDIVTMEDVVENMAVTQFAERPDLYGHPPFDRAASIDPTDTGALIHWRAGRLEWNPDHQPWFYRDIWPILFRPDQYTFLCDILQASNYPHNQSTRGTFDPYKLGVPPVVHRKGLRDCERRCLQRHHSGELFIETLIPTLLPLDRSAEEIQRSRNDADDGILGRQVIDKLLRAVATFISDAHPGEPGDADFDAYSARWNVENEAAGARKDRLEREVVDILDDIELPRETHADVRRLVLEHLRRFHNGKILGECRLKCVAANTHDPFGPMRTFLFNLLRKPGEENDFAVTGKPTSRVHNLPLMPLLCGDNPITNTLVSKFLRLTDYQYYLLRQWARGFFFNEVLEKWGTADPWWPYAAMEVRTARQLDRGVLTHILGGSFCPGGELGWTLRNPAIWRMPYRVKADPAFYNFAQTAAQANANQGGGNVPEADYSSYSGADLSQDNDFETGLQPGDLTKYMSCPWQADFNECSTQMIDITYERWNIIYADSDNNKLLEREQRVWQTLWWPAHRPMQTFEVQSVTKGQPDILWMDWTPGVPQTPAGDLKMVTEWWRLPFVVRNPYATPWSNKPTSIPPPSPLPYVSIGRTKREKEKS